MSAVRHAQVKELFLHACGLEGAARDEFLAEACAGDAELRTAVLELLVNDAGPPAWLDAADAGGAARWLAQDLDQHDEIEAAIPERIGAYRIVRLLGRGGMGAVFEAEQENPHRRVALKILAAGLGTAGHLHRFQQEAQLLGRLKHPGIAHVYEAGVAEIQGAKQPYFAMELVEGAHLLEHAASAQLGLGARLELLVQVCDAVQHAHDEGVLHRDLKSSNIAVDASGRAKVLDFGVARLIERGPGDVASTVSGVVVGTLTTMSPEQVSGSPSGLDERSDVYSLGVIAYEMLTGRPPLDVARLPLPQAAWMICETMPAPAGSHDRALRGDVETILTKALAKDRAQRYPSARDLAADLRRYLGNQPIVARPPSTFYQLRMFTRRNRALVAGVAVAAAALVLGAAAAGWFAWRENALRVVADSEAYRANVVAAHLELKSGNPAHARVLLDASTSSTPAWEWRRVRRELESWITQFPGPRYVVQAGFLDGGRAVVAIGSSGEIRIWNVASQQLESELPADPRRADVLGLSADGAQCVSLHGQDLCLWDTRTGAERGRLSAPTGTLSDPRAVACFSPAGRWLAVHGQCFDLRDHDRPPRVIGWGPTAFDGSDRTLAVLAGGVIRVEEADTGRVLHRFEFPGEARALALDASGRWLAAADRSRVHLFDLTDGSARVLAAVHTDVPTALAFQPDGLRIAAMQEDGSLWIHDGALDRVVQRSWVGRSSWKSSLAWNPGGDQLVSAVWTHGTVRLWDAREDREVLRGHTSYVYPVAYTPDGARIVSGGWDRTVRVWSATTGAQLATLAGHGGQRVHDLSIAPDGARLVSASDDGALILWDARTGAQLARTESEGAWLAVAWSPAGDRIAAASTFENGAIRILDARDLATVSTLAGVSGDVTALAYARDGQSLVSGNETGTVLLWDLEHGRERRRLTGKGVVQALEFSPDRRELVVAGWGRLALFDAHTLVQRVALVGHPREVFAAAFSPDGSRLASGGRDGRLWLWDVATGDRVGTFDGHGDYIWSVAFHPDGSRIATGSGDGTVRQWECEPAPITHARRVEGERFAHEAGPLVAALVAELATHGAVAERLTTDPALAPGARQAALDELLRLACAGQ